MDFDEKFFTEEIQGHIDHPHFLQRAKWIKEYVPDYAVVYIFGCGFGHLVKHLRELGVNAYGYDVSLYAFEHRVSKFVYNISAENFKISDVLVSSAFIFSWNMLDCLDEETAKKISVNIKNFSNQIHVLCCYGNYNGYYIQSKGYWEDLFPNALIIDYHHPISDLNIPTSWGSVSN